MVAKMLYAISNPSVATLGEVILRTRRARKLSQSELARLAEVDRQTISNIETGRTKDLRGEGFRNIARALGLTVDELTAQVSDDPDDVQLIRAILDRLARITDEPVKMLLEFVARKERAVKPRRIKNNPPARRGNIKRLADLDENEIVR